MNKKVIFAKEFGKSAAYIFVIGGLLTTSYTQFARTRAAFRLMVRS